MPPPTLPSWSGASRMLLTAWGRSELLCLLTVGTLLLGPTGVELVADAVRDLVTPAPTHAVGRVVAIRPDAGLLLGFPAPIVDYEVCGRAFSQTTTERTVQRLRVGMLFPVTLGVVTQSGARIEVLPDLFDAHEPRPGQAYVADCTKAPTQSRP